ncbi:hypothetical protein GSI_00927 [Ganoderma sinense ZZ0214-1]|uniref:Uncharacterized protein n=1 Tax=Ganoderma sinense ZZ0214-1 TaxID=1077348 RepID=A0A2G8SU06_9APHY|nr:hypothetical protein GSI_00927 [Ganoderma sinense ZZ0214-1]
MDLDDFDLAIAQLSLDDESSESAQSAKNALNHIDAQWYSPLTRGGRWMDLIGDYAGSEPFIVDGTSIPLDICWLLTHDSHLWHR